MNQISPALVEDTEQQLDRGLWPDQPPSFGARNLDDLLIWAYREGASDIRLQTNTPVFIQIHGRMRQVTSRGLTQAEIEEAVNRLYGADGQARLKGGSDFDVSYEVRPDRRTRMRFRVNATAVFSGGNDGGAVTARTLPSKAPNLADLRVEEAICRAFKPDDGIVLVAGGTGNGKSTLLAAMTRDMLHPVEAASPTSPTPSAGGMQP